MTKARDVDPAFVRELLELRDGVFYRRERPLHLFWCEAHGRHWNRRFAGKPAHVRLSPAGYRTVRYAKIEMLEHRVLWLFHHGVWPSGEIDHLNGVRTDNRIENLRDCDKSTNMRNQKLRRDSTSGFPGVHFCPDKRAKQWAARIGLNGTWKHLGRFKTKQEAIDCRLAAQLEYGFTARHGESIAA
jgi:hypothetical protein